jgi:hypothetical protein
MVVEEDHAAKVGWGTAHGSPWNQGPCHRDASLRGYDGVPNSRFDHGGSRMSATAPTVIALRPFLPSKDFQKSQQFYGDLGFQVSSLGDDLALAELEGHSFLLQNYFDERFSNGLMMHLLVNNLDEWWSKVRSLRLAERYGVKEPAPPRDESWGLTVLYVIDPAGVLWHIAQRIRATR